MHVTEYAHNVYPPITLKEGLDFHPHSRVSRWKPGSRMAYANSGPAVAARIVENITAVDFEDYIKTHFFNPMGMSSASYQRPSAQANAATLYDANMAPQPYWNIIMRPSGSINASAKDMAKFVAFFLSRGRVNDVQLISEESINRMETVGSTTAAAHGQVNGYGLSNLSSTHGQWIYREHGGGVMGGISELAYLPEANAGHAIVVNSGNYEAFSEISKLVRNYETRDLPPKEPTIEEYTVDDQDKSIEGLYRNINPRIQQLNFLNRLLNIVRLSFDDNVLVARGFFGGDSREFIPVNDTQYVRPKTGDINISRVVDPLVGEVVHIGMDVYKKTTTIAVYAPIAIFFLWVLSMVVSILFFPIWIVRKLRKKIPGGATLAIRVWPLLATLSIVIFLAAGILGQSGDVFSKLGRPSVYSIAIMIASIAFFVFSVLGAFTVVKHRNSEINVFAYWSSTLLSFTHLAVAMYLLWFGWIGMRFWAY